MGKIKNPFKKKHGKHGKPSSEMVSSPKAQKAVEYPQAGAPNEFSSPKRAAPEVSGKSVANAKPVPNAQSKPVAEDRVVPLEDDAPVKAQMEPPTTRKEEKKSLRNSLIQTEVPFVNPDGKFKPASAKDAPFVAIMAVVTLISTAVALYGNLTYDDTGAYTFVPMASEYFREAIVVLSIVGAFAEITAVGWTAALLRLQEHAVLVSVVVSALFFLALASFCFAFAAYAVGALLVVAAALHGLLFRWWHKRRGLVEVMLHSARHVIFANRSVFGVVLAVGAVQFGWLLFWTWCIGGTQEYSPSVGWWFQIIMIALLWWVGEAFSNFVRTICCGVFSRWYFVTRTNAEVKYPVLPAMRTALKAVGSVALGSLLAPPISLLRWFLNLIRDQSVVLLCTPFLMKISEITITKFNYYGFVDVAIYGKKFKAASVDAWKRFESEDTKALVDEPTMSGLLWLGSVIGGVSCALCGAIVAELLVPRWWTMCTLFAFLIGFYAVSFGMAVVRAACDTLLVCFVMDPDSLRRHDSDFWAELVNVYEGWQRL